MSINRLFDSIEQAREAADCRAAFGEPQVVEDRILIPVARVGYAFGLGFGSGGDGPEREDAAAAEGGGGGGAATSKPLGTLVVTPDGVYFEEIPDTKLALFGIGLAAFIVLQVAKTLRVILGR